MRESPGYSLAAGAASASQAGGPLALRPPRPPSASTLTARAAPGDVSSFPPPFCRIFPSEKNTLSTVLSRAHVHARDARAPPHPSCPRTRARTACAQPWPAASSPRGWSQRRRARGVQRVPLDARDALPCRTELGAPRPPVHAAAVGTGVRDAGGDDSDPGGPDSGDSADADTGAPAGAALGVDPPALALRSSPENLSR